MLTPASDAADNPDMIRRIMLGVLSGVLLSGPTLAQPACKLTPIGTAEVAAVRDGRTLSLADGRILRLAGIEATDAGRAALARLAIGKRLRLAATGPARDRYGRLVGFAFAGNSSHSLQQVLLAAGAALVGARAGGMACARPLLAAEAEARAVRRGIWADSRYRPQKAGDLTRLRGDRGRFTLVEGKVLSVHPSGGTIYLNFGRRWTRDFSVLIVRRRRPAFAAAGLDPLRMKGRTILVRGVVEIRRGPLIEAEAPEQIELTDSAAVLRASQ
ncbi:MAG TPA: thermonuclease family protein [Pseudolabrys sp.]|nr:thermonuclease family protein [Pseudolabrys sp.]